MIAIWRHPNITHQLSLSKVMKCANNPKPHSFHTCIIIKLKIQLSLFFICFSNSYITRVHKRRYIKEIHFNMIIQIIFTFSQRLIDTRVVSEIQHTLDCTASLFNLRTHHKLVSIKVYLRFWFSKIFFLHIFNSNISITSS